MISTQQRCRHLRRPELFRLSARQLSCSAHPRYHLHCFINSVQRAAQNILVIDGFDALLGFPESRGACNGLLRGLLSHRDASDGM